MNEHQDDFSFFTDPRNEAAPSRDADEKVLAYIKNELEPKHHRIFAKLLGLQIIVGLLTMLICPQFTLGFGDNFMLFHFIHHAFGEQACYAFCGALFTGPTVFLFISKLRDKEIDFMGNTWPLYFAGLFLVALTSFWLFGVELDLELTLFWLTGAFLTSASVFTIARKRLLKT